MAGIQNTTLRIPDEWSASWFRVFCAEVIARADVRNAIGVGVTITSNGNSVATISADSETAGAVSGHNADPLAHAEAFSAHRSETDPHPQYATKQPDVVADVAGGATVDAECRAQLNALLAVLRASGVIST